MLREIYGSSDIFDNENMSRTQIIGLNSKRSEQIPVLSNKNFLHSGQQTIENQDYMSQKQRNLSLKSDLALIKVNSPKQGLKKPSVISKEKSVEKLMMMDNPNTQHLSQINKYDFVRLNFFFTWEGRQTIITEPVGELYHQTL